MPIKKIFRYYVLGQSKKEVELNRILDKLNTNKKLSKREREFLELYHCTNNIEEVDYMYISKNTAYKKIRMLLENDITIICNLCDRDGKIGMKIRRIENHMNEDYCTLYFGNDENYKMTDNYVYNLILNEKRYEYSLEVQDEYYEKLYINND